MRRRPRDVPGRAAPLRSRLFFARLSRCGRLRPPPDGNRRGGARRARRRASARRVAFPAAPLHAHAGALRGLRALARAGRRRGRHRRLSRERASHPRRERAHGCRRGRGVRFQERALRADAGRGGDCGRPPAAPGRPARDSRRGQYPRTGGGVGGRSADARNAAARDGAGRGAALRAHVQTYDDARGRPGAVLAGA